VAETEERVTLLQIADEYDRAALDVLSQIDAPDTLICETAETL
jgi:hypothetical protein